MSQRKDKTVLEVSAIIVNRRDVRNEPGYIVFEDGVISEIGKGAYPANTSGEEVTLLRRPGTVAMPGFVNSHGHAAMTLLRGAGDDLPLMDWLNKRIFPLEAKLTGEAIYWGTQLACWEMIKSGTTCFTDMYMSMDDVARAVDESGMRAVLSWGVVGFDEQSQQSGIHNTTRFIQDWHGRADGRITTMVAPHAPYTCPPDYMRRLAELSEELNVPIQIHLSETRIEVENSVKNYGVSPIRHALNCGVLARPVLAAHCVHVSEDDIQIMREHHVKVAHNPQSNLKLASGVAPVVQMKRGGVTVGLGTDGAASNNNLDMFEELRLAATLHKGILYDASVLPAAEAFAMATEDSAACCNLPQSHGTLQVGAAADITLLDLHSPHFLPTYDLLSNVVYSAGADDVLDVFIQGKQVLEQGTPVSMDVERIEYEVRKIEAFLKRN